MLKIRGSSGYPYSIYKVTSNGDKWKYIGKRHIYWTDSGARYIKTKKGKFIPANRLKDSKKGIIYIIK